MAAWLVDGNFKGLMMAFAIPQLSSSTATMARGKLIATCDMRYGGDMRTDTRFGCLNGEVSLVLVDCI